MSSIKDKLVNSTRSRRHSAASSTGPRSSHEEPRDPAMNGEDEIVDEVQGNILTHLISQLRPGADLSRVTLPTFILEPRSMLERITNFMAHPETLLPMPEIEDPIQRFVSVVRFYLSGWHIRPPGVKKPLNPLLGETFSCYWQYPDNTYGYYLSEQTSHHPPKSSYFFMAPEHGIRIDGTLKPRSKFLGNSAASMMEGIAVMRFLKRNERYFVTQPNIYSRGILFGKMKYELGDHSFVRCPELGLEADIEFKTKGYFGGTYNAIGGFIKETRTGKQLYELNGLWTSDMYIKDLATAQKTLLFSVAANPPSPPLARPIPEQDERESQRLWKKVTDALRVRNQEVATEEKTKIEDMQREEAAKRADDGVDWRPQLFRAVDAGGKDREDEGDLDWILSAPVDAQTPEEQTKQILNIAAILPCQSPNRRFSIPERPPSKKTPESTISSANVSAGTEAAEQAVEATCAPAAAAAPTEKAQTVPKDEDLIDFGRDSGAATPVPLKRQLHNPPPAPQPYDGTQDLLGGDITPPKVGEPGHALVPALEKLMLEKSRCAPADADQLPADVGRVRRVDSETKDFDDFVDAES